MKKIVSVLFTALLALQVTNVSYASATEIKNPEQISEKLDYIQDLKANIRLEDRTIKVDYKEEAETVKVIVKKDSEKQSYEWTDQEVKEKLTAFLKTVKIEDTWSKEELARKFASALELLPSKIISLNTDIQFDLGQQVSTSYKAGMSDKPDQSYLPNQLDLDITGENGHYYNVFYKTNGKNVTASIEKNTANGKKTYDGIYALIELARIKDALMPKEEMQMKDYINTLSAELGIPASEINHIQLKTKFQDKTSVKFDYKK